MTPDGKRSTCKIVFIPADPHQEIEERTVVYDIGEQNEVSCVQDYAKAHFRSIKPSKTANQQEAQRKLLLDQVPEEQRKQLTDGLINQAMDMDLVEHVALLSNATDNNFTGVTMYCDDEAVAVGLPVNLRASEIARCAGKILEVHGDVFLARVFDSEVDFKRLDFNLSEVSSTSPWVKEAFAQNERKHKAESAEATLERIEQSAKASARVTELTPAEVEKERGNSLFKEGKFIEACEAYSRAIEMDPHLMVAYSNRAMTRLKLGDFQGAETDCDRVLLQAPTTIKALLRRASARESLQRRGEALQDYREIVMLEPNNRVAIKKVQELEADESKNDAINRELELEESRE